MPIPQEPLTNRDADEPRVKAADIVCVGQRSQVWIRWPGCAGV